MKSMKHLDLQMRLTIVNAKSHEDFTFGKGVVSLLRGVETLGSLNASAKSMRMAYSKAWRIVKEAEGCCGFDLIDRNGALGSTLTKEGKKLLDAYAQLETDGQAFLSQRLCELLA